MKRLSFIFYEITVYFFILLFFYASVSKILDFENFQVQIAQSPILSAYAGIMSYGVIIIEFLTVGFLCFPGLRKLGLYASTGLMSAFTVYIYLILNYSDFIPCSCGGILEKMDWTEHLIFNSIFVLIGIAAVLFPGYSVLGKIRRSAVTLSLCISMSISLVFALFLSSEYIIKNENNFTRRFFPNGLVEKASLKLDDKFYYFSGTYKDQVFLGNISHPLRTKVLDKNLTSGVDFRIKLDNYVYLFKNLKLQTVSSNYYLYDGTVPIIYQGKIGQPDAKTISYKDAYFDQLSVVDSTHFVFRTISGKTKAFTLGSLSLNAEKKVKLHPELLKKQTDGIFDSDGFLISDRRKKQLVYTYSYRNQILVFDQNLSTNHIQNTIDTTTLAKTRTTTLSNGKVKMSAPSIRVNTLQTVQDQYLFNESQLMGKNESGNRWNSSSIIDIYNIEKRSYVGSVYIPHRNGKKLNGLLLNDDRLYAILGDEIVYYHFRKNLAEALR